MGSITLVRGKISTRGVPELPFANVACGRPSGTHHGVCNTSSLLNILNMMCIAYPVDSVACSGLASACTLPANHAMRTHPEAIKTLTGLTHVCLNQSSYMRWCACPRLLSALLSRRAVDGVSHVPGHSRLGHVPCKGNSLRGLWKHASETVHYTLFLLMISCL
jgi:hypothetical protein